MFSELYPVDGFGYEDAVPRLIAFRLAHPEWTVHLSFGLWRAWRELPDVGGGEEHVRVRLDHLLDVLEAIALRDVASRGSDDERREDAGADNDTD